MGLWRRRGGTSFRRCYEKRTALSATTTNGTAISQSPLADVSWPPRDIHFFSKLSAIPLEIDQPCEVSPSHAVMQPLSLIQILRLLRSLCLPLTSDIGLCDEQAPAGSLSKETESGFLSCIRNHPIRRSMLRQHCGLIVNEGRTA